MDDEELRQALIRFDDTLRQVETNAGCGLGEHYDRILDAHRRVLSHLLQDDTVVLVTSAVGAAKRALLTEAPAAELQEIHLVRHSIGRMLDRPSRARPG